MMDIITEANREDYFRRLYIDVDKFRKQRITGAVSGAFFGLMIGVAAYFMGNGGVSTMMLMLLLTAVGGYIGWKLKYYELTTAVKTQNNRLSLMFPEFLQTFIALLESSPTSSIVTILETTVPYLKSPIRQQIVKLVNAIYQDGTDSQVRISMMNFASYINSPEASRIMSLIYSMYVEGANPEILKELNEKVTQLNNNKVDAYVSKKATALSGKAFPSLVLGVFYILVYVGLVGLRYVSDALIMM